MSNRTHGFCKSCTCSHWVGLEAKYVELDTNMKMVFDSEQATCDYMAVRPSIVFHATLPMDNKYACNVARQMYQEILGAVAMEGDKGLAPVSRSIEELLLRRPNDKHPQLKEALDLCIKHVNANPTLGIVAQKHRISYLTDSLRMALRALTAPWKQASTGSSETARALFYREELTLLLSAFKSIPKYYSRCGEHADTDTWTEHLVQGVASLFLESRGTYDLDPTTHTLQMMLLSSVSVARRTIYTASMYSTNCCSYMGKTRSKTRIRVSEREENATSVLRMVAYEHFALNPCSTIEDGLGVLQNSAHVRDIMELFAIETTPVVVPRGRLLGKRRRQVQQLRSLPPPPPPRTPPLVDTENHCIKLNDFPSEISSIVAGFLGFNSSGVSSSLNESVKNHGAYRLLRRLERFIAHTSSGTYVNINSITPRNLYNPCIQDWVDLVAHDLWDTNKTTQERLAAIYTVLERLTEMKNLVVEWGTPLGSEQKTREGQSTWSLDVFDNKLQFGTSDVIRAATTFGGGDRPKAPFHIYFPTTHNTQPTPIPLRHVMSLLCVLDSNKDVYNTYYLGRCRKQYVDSYHDMEDKQRAYVTKHMRNTSFTKPLVNSSFTKTDTHYDTHMCKMITNAHSNEQQIPSYLVSAITMYGIELGPIKYSDNDEFRMQRMEVGCICHARSKLILFLYPHRREITDKMKLLTDKELVGEMATLAGFRHDRGLGETAKFDDVIGSSDRETHTVDNLFREVVGNMLVDGILNIYIENLTSVAGVNELIQHLEGVKSTIDGHLPVAMDE